MGSGNVTYIICKCHTDYCVYFFSFNSPFGLDKVDIPMEAFCATVEAQVNAIDERAKDGTILKFATGGVGKVKRSGKKLTSTVTIPKLR